MEKRNANISDEYSTNKYALRFMIVLELVVLCVWFLNTINIFIIDKDLMNHASIGTTIIFLLGFIGHYLVGFERSLAKYYYILIIYAMITYMSIFLTYHIFISIFFPLTFALQYRNKYMTLFSYILAIVGIIVSIILGYSMGLCDANMLLLTYTTTQNQIEIFESAPLVYNDNLGLLVLYYAAPRCIIVTAAIPLLNHIANTITDKAISELEHKKAAETDGLTGLLNKNAFLFEAENTYNSLGHNSGAFLFIDMDHFKSVNDTLGHAIGDIAIKDVANEIKEVFRHNDLIGRFGGDEFVVFLTNMPEKLLKERLEDLRLRLEKSYSDEKTAVNISASIGAVYFESQPIYPFGKIMNMADAQVYAAKDSGRNNISFVTIGALAK